MRRSFARLGSAVAVVALLAAGCGSDEEPGAKPPEASGAELAALVPPEIASAGSIKVGSSLAVPPLYFPDEDGKPTGLLVEILESAAQHLGVTITWSQVATGAQAVAIRSGKIDMSGSQFDPTPEVLESGIVVTAYNTSTGLLVPAGNPEKIEEITDLCGLTLALGRGAFTDLAASETVIKRCEEAGKEAPDVKMFDGAGESQTALRSGRVDGYFVASSVTNYSARTASNQFDSVLEAGFENVHEGGVLFAKDDTALAKAIQAAINAMIEDGSYAEILEGWKLETMAIDASQLVTAP